MAEKEGLAVRASEGKRRVVRSVSVNGVSAVGIELKKSQNLSDPILNVNVKVNNPIGRLWLALKRLWKSQNTVVALRFTIPLIVLPIVIYVGWAIWQGRGVRTPMSKLGLVHRVMIAGEPKDILVVPTSDVFILEYSTAFDESRVLREKPVIVIGMYKHIDNLLVVDGLIPYNPADIAPSTEMKIEKRSMWDTITSFITQFK